MELYAEAHDQRTMNFLVRGRCATVHLPIETFVTHDGREERGVDRVKTFRVHGWELNELFGGEFQFALLVRNQPIGPAHYANLDDLQQILQAVA